jgi:CRISPR-associated exonuclease Cas4
VELSSRSPYGKISQVMYIKDKPLFPISWLQKQDYCEYQIYLENIKGIKVKPTKAMVVGKEEHQELYDRFAKEAVPATVEQILTESKTAKILSREFRVIDEEHGIHGFIDEVWLNPDSFVVIDDKPGARVYLSSIRQVLGYCLAFKSVTVQGDTRQVIAALRERGTDNICWQSPFNQQTEEEIVAAVNHIHALISGQAEFTSSNNPNKCKGCRLKGECDRSR